LAEKIDIGVIAKYVRHVNGQILVTSELGRGTVFSLELPFEPAPVPEGQKSRKLRKLFMPSQSSKSAPSPSMLPSINYADVNLNRSQRRVETKPFSPQSTSLLSDSGIGSSPRPYSYDTKEDVVSHDSCHLNNQSHTTPVSLNVLIAEDDSKSLRMLDEKLSQLGHNVDSAYDGQACHDRFASNPSKIDVILMELKVCTFFE